MIASWGRSASELVVIDQIGLRSEKPFAPRRVEWAIQRAKRSLDVDKMPIADPKAIDVVAEALRQIAQQREGATAQVTLLVAPPRRADH